MVMSARGVVEIQAPSRMMVMRSACWKTSSRRWEMKRMATPSAFSRLMMANNWATSCADSDAVGSSMMSTRVSSESALAISTVCCCARVSVEAGACTSRWTSRRARTFLASARMRPLLTMRPRSRWPMKMFSATVRSGKTMGSW